MSVNIQQQVAELLGDGCWRNMGFWGKTDDYVQACRQMARAVGEAARMSPGKRLLDVGFGSAAQLLFWMVEFGVQAEDLVGLELDAAAVGRVVAVEAGRWPQGRRPEVLVQDAVRYSPSRESGNSSNSNSSSGRNGSNSGNSRNSGSGRNGGRNSGSCNSSGSNGGNKLFDCVVSVDNAYHFQTRAQFFTTARRQLKPGGRLVLADATVKSNLSWLGRLVLCVLRCGGGSLGLPSANLVNIGDYCDQLRAAGFNVVGVSCTTNQVFAPFASHLLFRARFPLPPQRSVGDRCVLWCTGLFMYLASSCLDFSVFTAVAN